MKQSKKGTMIALAAAAIFATPPLAIAEGQAGGSSTEMSNTKTTKNACKSMQASGAKAKNSCKSTKTTGQ